MYRKQVNAMFDHKMSSLYKNEVTLIVRTQKG